jgi:hypothetical protein
MVQDGHVQIDGETFFGGYVVGHLEQRGRQQKLHHLGKLREGQVRISNHVAEAQSVDYA